MELASQVRTRLADRYCRKLCDKNGGQGLPEFCLPVLILVACIAPVGLFCYGWSARPTAHWIMPNFGAGIYGAGTVLGILCVVGELFDGHVPKVCSKRHSCRDCPTKYSGFCIASYCT